MRDRRIVLALIAILAIALVVRHPTADIRIFAHEAADPSPRRVQAAVDMGIAAVSVIVTWSARHALD